MGAGEDPAPGGNLMNTNENTKATETRNPAEETSNIVSQRYLKAEKILKGVVRPGINLFAAAFVKLVQIACWVLIPLAAVQFADIFSMQFSTSDPHGQLAILATYGVAIFAGIRGAAEASARIGTFTFNPN